MRVTQPVKAVAPLVAFVAVPIIAIIAFRRLGSALLDGLPV